MQHADPPPPPVLPATIAEAADRFADQPAFVSADGWPISYAQLHAISDEVAVGLAAEGIGERDVVVLALPSTIDYVVAYLALAKLGAVTAGLNPTLALVERQRLVELADPVMVLGTDELDVDRLGAPSLAVRPATGLDDALASLRRTGTGPSPLEPDAARPVCLVFTSGTTGTPKGALFTDGQLDSIRRLELGDAWGGGGASIASTQFAHVGVMTKLPWTLRLGGTVHLLPKWRAADVLDLIERTRVSSVGAIAPQLALMLADPRFDERDLSCVRAIIAGGAASPPALIEETQRRFGADYLVRYSSTESGGIGTGTAPGADDVERYETVGRPRPGVEVRIDDGEVCLRSPAVMARYWRDAEATADALRDGWLHTGDLGELDDDGRLRLLGRSKEMFIRGGYNVFPVEVEAVLASHPAVAEVVVVPRADPVMGEIGVAVVVTRSGHEAPSLDELRSHGETGLARWKLPEAIAVVDELPRTSALKIDRRRLIETVGG